MKKILITGADGQLGNELRKASGFFTGMHFTFTDVQELDITDLKSMENFFNHKRYDFLINCAAYTAVDKAEDEPGTAGLVNTKACENLAHICRSHHITLVHISTDFVFDGMKTGAYCETDPPNPLSVYGKTKLDGEEAIRRICTDSLIIRTSWLFSAFGNNFVKTIIKKAAELKQLKVVFDQMGSPTYAGDLAALILNLLEKQHFQGNLLYHYANEGAISWYDFAMAIIELAGIKCEITPVRTWEYPLKAKRPLNSVLDKSKIKHDFGIEIPHWRKSLGKCIKELSTYE